MALITKAHFNQYVQFTQNIPDRIIDFHILKAETLDFKPLVPADFWTIINTGSPGMGAELETFFDDYIIPILVHFAMLRFLTEAGTNITQFGVVAPREDTSEPASMQLRADIKNQYHADLQAYLNKFYARLKDAEYTFDGVTYDFDCEPKQKKMFIGAI